MITGLQYSTVQYTTVQYTTVQYSTVQYSPNLDTVSRVWAPPVTSTVAEKGSGMEQAYLVKYRTIIVMKGEGNSIRDPTNCSYAVSYFISKLVSVVPSCFTISDVVPLLTPPISSVPSSTLQDTWPCLSSCRVWPVRAQVPVAGLNCSQVVPPQARRPSWECQNLSSTRLADTRHELPVPGTNTSADWPTSVGEPPVMRMAAVGH